LSESRKKSAAPITEDVSEVKTEAVLEDMSMAEKGEFDYSIRCDRAQVADHLEILARSFREGQVKLAAGDKSIALVPSPRVKLEVKAETKPEKNKGELRIKVSWKENNTAKSLSISPVA